MFATVFVRCPSRTLFTHISFIQAHRRSFGNVWIRALLLPAGFVGQHFLLKGASLGPTAGMLHASQQCSGSTPQEPGSLSVDLCKVSHE